MRRGQLGIGKLAALGAIVALVYLYVSAGASLLSAMQASKVASAKVASLQRENVQLKRSEGALSHTWVTEAEARRLGMAHANEKVYVVAGLPKN